MAEYGGFDHNVQSFKVVTRLERKYASFDGLNLTFETLEGLAKHNGPLPVAAKEWRKAMDRAGTPSEALYPDLYAPAEAQVAAVADDVAYNSHDLDDGLRAGLLNLDALADVPLAGRFVRETQGGTLDKRRIIYEVNRRIITAMIDDVVAESRLRLAALPTQTLQGVRQAGRPVIAASDVRRDDLAGLKAYLFANVYRHPRVMRVVTAAERIVRDLFGRYMDAPGEMPGFWRAAAERTPSETERAIVISDFVAGMTDRFAIQEHARLFDATPELR
jgi:dGTPase